MSFFVNAGFKTAETIVTSSSDVSVHSLAMLNAIFGCTESSRAVAGIIALLKHELNKPEAGEVVGYKDLVFAMAAFVLLQRWGRRQTQIDFRNAGGEEGIWDVVLDDRGFRADVVGTRRQTTILPVQSHAAPSLHFTSAEADIDFEAFEKGTLVDGQHFDLDADEHGGLPDEEIRERIIRQLPEGARAVITSETFTSKTIKVDIFDAETAHIEAPPGTIMVAERLNHDDSSDPDAPNQTVVFRTSLQRTSSAELAPTEKLRLTSADVDLDMVDQEDVVMMKDSLAATADSAFNGSFDQRLALNGDRDEGWTDRNGSSKVADQRKSRKPAFNHLRMSSPPSTSKIPTRSSDKIEGSTARPEKGSKMRKVLKTLSPSSSSTAMKDLPGRFAGKQNGSAKPLPQLPKLTPLSHNRTPTPQRTYPMPSLSNGHSPLSSPVMSPSPEERRMSNYFSVHETRRNSSGAQTETYSVHSVGSRSGSPTYSRKQTRITNGLSKTKSEQAISIAGTEFATESVNTSGQHHRSKSFVPSLYSMGSKRSGEAVVLQPRRPIPRKSIYEDQTMVELLQNEGKVPGIFPDAHLVKTIRRFCRFATASYGDRFLEVMGLSRKDWKTNISKEVTMKEHHVEHTSFSTHTGLPADAILLSSFVDPAGSPGNTAWSPSAFSPLVHYISVDHDSRAVVLTCRGTLGFEDILTDMTCDFDDLVYQGHRYKVHRGIHASARRLLGGSSSRVMAQLKDTLDEYEDYGLVLCGHSLGGAVAALLAILIAEPAPGVNSHSFITGSPPKLLMPSTTNIDKTTAPPIRLPAGRPIHVYSYGTPATVSEPLRLATRGLITTVANANDIVPSLSLGTLNDARTIAVHIKHDTDEALGKIRSRVWSRMTATIYSYNDPARSGPPAPETIAGPGIGQDSWSWSALKTLRASMVNDKLVPPGEVFLLESTQVFDRLGTDVKQEAKYGNSEETQENREEKLYKALGRPATRIQFKLVKDVERRFAEIRFGSDMFGDHSPGRYENRLSALEAGVCEE